MNKFSKKTAFGIATVGAATALVAGMASPAMATTSHDSSLGNSSSHSASTTDSRSTSTVTRGQLDALRSVTTGLTGGDLKNTSPVVISPSVGVGDVASGNAIGSGNDVPLVSGNEVPVASGNEANGNSVTAPVASGDESAVGNVSGNSISSSVKDLVQTVTSGNSATSDPTSSVSGTVSNITGDLGLDTILGGR